MIHEPNPAWAKKAKAFVIRSHGQLWVFIFTGITTLALELAKGNRLICAVFLQPMVRNS